MPYRSQRDRQENISSQVHDLQVPAAPIDIVGLAFLPQLLDRLEGLVMRSLQV